MQLEVLQILWYLVVALAIMFYTVLDGFDLGVGALHLFVKGDVERRILLNSIGPFWDGNEVWLVIILGALFAGFPPVYSAVLTGFYLLMIFFIFALMLRAAAIEFRSKKEGRSWRSFWDTVFAVTSILLGFAFGFLLGNFVIGVPFDQEGVFQGAIGDLFRPYPILLGFTSLMLLSMHGGVFLLLKTEGAVHVRLRNMLPYLIGGFIVLYLITSFATLYFLPHMTRMILRHPGLILFPLLTLASILNVPYQVNRGRDGLAFISSCCSIVFLFILFGLGTFPYLVISSLDESFSMTLFNSSSSALTLKILLLIVCLGVPLVLGYGYWIYRTFRGKVRLDKLSY